MRLPVIAHLRGVRCASLVGPESGVGGATARVRVGIEGVGSVLYPINVARPPSAPRQALTAVPQLADGLSALGRKSAENLHSVCDMCVANLAQLEDAGAAPEVAAGLAGRSQRRSSTCSSCRHASVWPSLCEVQVTCQGFRLVPVQMQYGSC